VLVTKYEKQIFAEVAGSALKDSDSRPVLTPYRQGIQSGHGLRWRIHSAAAAQTATIPKKKAAPSYFPLMTLITPNKMRHDQYHRFHSSHERFIFT
jgi:hypothetical protein